MRYKFLKIALLVWVALWIWFVVRDLFLKDNINSYRILFARPLEGKHSYVTGDRLYEFLAFSAAHLPPGFSYNFAGLEPDSIESRRAVYYLYPGLEKEGPDYILVYDRPGFKKEGYDLMIKLDGSRYILKSNKRR